MALNPLRYGSSDCKCSSYTLPSRWFKSNTLQTLGHVTFFFFFFPQLNDIAVKWSVSCTCIMPAGSNCCSIVFLQQCTAVFYTALCSCSLEVRSFHSNVLLRHCTAAFITAMCCCGIVLPWFIQHCVVAALYRGVHYSTLLLQHWSTTSYTGKLPRLLLYSSHIVTLFHRPSPVLSTAVHVFITHISHIYSITLISHTTWTVLRASLVQVKAGLEICVVARPQPRPSSSEPRCA